MNNEESLQTNNDSDHKVRVNMHSTNLMFGEIRKDGSFKEDGIILSSSEHRALFAIQKMLDKTNYEGNVPGLELQSHHTAFNYSGKLPRITFTPTEYLEAYGLDKKLTSRGFMEYSSNERQAALKALQILADKKFRIVYKRKTYDGNKKPVIDRIETNSPLLRISKGYFGLTQQEDEILDNGGDEKVDNKALICVEVCPLLVDQIDGYFILLDPNLHTIAKELAGKKKQSKYPALFINWLTVQREMQRRGKTTGAEIKIGVTKLAGKLRMYDLLKDYQWKKIQEIFEECFAVGRGMGLLQEAVIEDEMVKISLPKKDGFSTHKKRNLCPNKTESLPK